MASKTTTLPAIALTAAALAGSGAAWAAEADGQADLDVTITVITDETPVDEAVEHALALPEQADDVARERLEQAARASERGRRFGEGVAERARELQLEGGAGLGAEVSAEARGLRGEMSADAAAEARELRGEVGGDLGAEVAAEARDMREDIGPDMAAEARREFGAELGADMRADLPR